MPETNRTPVRKRPVWVAFVAAGIGVVLLNEAVDSFHVHAFSLLLAIQTLVGIVCLVLAVLWGTKRI